MRIFSLSSMAIPFKHQFAEAISATVNRSAVSYFAPPGKIDALVEMAVRAAIDLYYRELESRGAN